MSHWGNGFTGLVDAVGRSGRLVVAHLFRRREILVRSGGRVRYLSLPGGTQLLLVGAVFAAGAWIGHTTHIWFDFDNIVGAKNREIARVHDENRDLARGMMRMRSQFSDVAGTLERNHVELEQLVAQNGDLRREIGALRVQLSSAENDRTTGEKEQAALRHQIQALESRLAGAEKRSASLAGDLEASRAALADAKRQRGMAENARDTLKSRVAGLERRLVTLRESQHTLVGRAAEKTTQDIERIERIILRAGLDVSELLTRRAGGKAGKGTKTAAAAATATSTAASADDGATGQGGPFIPAEAVTSVTSPERERFAVALRSYDRQLARWEEMQTLLRSLPLIAPLDHYKKSSGHGKRRDPINGRMAMHEGIDLTAERRAPVHATAPGKVVVAGWQGGFGRTVEIDHGYGIRTRYAHLHSISVKPGAVVTFGQNIGQVGNTGRSTGAHLHYEVLIDGKSHDPERFIKAGKDVFKG